MTSSLTLMALASLVPAIAGPLPQSGEAGAALVLALCNGGSIALAPGSAGALPQATTPCCAKGCRTGNRKTARKNA